MERITEPNMNDMQEMREIADKQVVSVQTGEKRGVVPCKRSGRWVFFLVLSLFVLVTSFLFLYPDVTDQGDHNMDAWNEVSYEEARELIASGKPFILFIYRPSCSACEVVTTYKDAYTGLGLPIYALSMEPYRETGSYDEIKEILNFYYMPCFKYLADGREQAHINNPLPDAFFETTDDRQRLTYIEEMISSVSSFIKAAADNGPLISEEPLPPVIHGTVIEKPESPN